MDMVRTIASFVGGAFRVTLKILAWLVIVLISAALTSALAIAILPRHPPYFFLATIAAGMLIFVACFLMLIGAGIVSACGLELLDDFDAFTANWLNRR